MTQQSSPPKASSLRSCVDRRFLAATRRAFERETSFGEAKYFHEAYAGGALNNPGSHSVNFPIKSPQLPRGQTLSTVSMGKTFPLPSWAGKSISTIAAAAMFRQHS
ncbi:MAG TPA: hypothetical protein VFV38_41660 [Ktedonobacteraceae bacterium]|nr:hypothetical protein [Ktedonobacteraceae bacterium]